MAISQTALDRIAANREAARKRGAANRASILSARGVSTPSASAPVVLQGPQRVSQSQISRVAAPAPTRESILAGGDPTPSRQFTRTPQVTDPTRGGTIDPAIQADAGARGAQQPQTVTATPSARIATSRQRGAQTVQPALTQAESPLASIDRLIAEQVAAQERARAEQASFLEDERSRISSRVATQFAPRFDQAAREGGRARETAQRFGAFAGSARGTRAEEQQQILNEQQSQLEAALAAEQQAEIERQMAIARGASDSELEAIGNRVSQLRDTRVNTQLKLEESRIEAEATADAIAMQAEADALRQRAAALEAAGFVEDPDTGERIETIKGRAQQLDEIVRLGQLEVSQRGQQLKEQFAPFEIAKLDAATKKLLGQTRSGAGGGGSAGFDDGTRDAFFETIIDQADATGKSIASVITEDFEFDEQEALNLATEVRVWAEDQFGAGEVVEEGVSTSVPGGQFPLFPLSPGSTLPGGQITQG